jgi:hypothetical protein
MEKRRNLSNIHKNIYNLEIEWKIQASPWLTVTSFWSRSRHGHGFSSKFGHDRDSRPWPWPWVTAVTAVTPMSSGDTSLLSFGIQFWMVLVKIFKIWVFTKDNEERKKLWMNTMVVQIDRTEKNDFNSSIVFRKRFPVLRKFEQDENLSSLTISLSITRGFFLSLYSHRS